MRNTSKTLLTIFCLAGCASESPLQQWDEAKPLTTTAPTHNEPANTTARTYPEVSEDLFIADLLRNSGRLSQADDDANQRRQAQSNANLQLTLQDSVRAALQHNLRQQGAELRSRQSIQQQAQSLAIFDRTIYATSEYGLRRDLAPYSRWIQDSRQARLNLGTRKRRFNGDLIDLYAFAEHIDNEPYLAQPYNDYSRAGVGIALTTPLGRGRGTQVTTADIAFSRHATTRQQATTQADANKLAAETATLAIQLWIQQHECTLLEQLHQTTCELRNRLAPRLNHDLQVADLAQVATQAELRRTEWLIALRSATQQEDALKAQMHQPALPVGSTPKLAIVLPEIEPLLQHQLPSEHEALALALTYRNELTVAHTRIDDARLRQLLAKDSMKAQLDMILRGEIYGVDEDNDPATAASQGAQRGGGQINLSLQYEQPLGQRAAKAALKQASLQGKEAALAWQDTHQQIVLETRQALRRVHTARQTLTSTRNARRAAWEALRVAELALKQGGSSQDSFTLQIERVLARQDQYTRALISEWRHQAECIMAQIALDQAQGLATVRWGNVQNNP